MALVIGLNSGSSFDGIDVVLIQINDGPDGYPARPRYLTGRAYDWPAAVGEIVLRSFENKVTLFEFDRLNYLAGAVYGNRRGPSCARRA